MNGGNRLCWFTRLAVARIAVLVVLAFPAGLQAQAAECSPSLHEVCGEADVQGFERFAAPIAGLGLNAPAPSAVTAIETGLASNSAEVFDLNPSEDLMDVCSPTARCVGWFQTHERPTWSTVLWVESAANHNTQDVVTKPAVVSVRNPKTPDLDRRFYYKNKIEFSLDGGWLPINIPFVFDVFLGDAYNMTSLKYTLVPIIGSLRWQIDDVGGPWILRGNWDFECSGTVTFIPRGPETRYFAWILGLRRNFVPRRGRIAPYFDGRLGMGDINAKEPLGVLYAQGQDFTFTVNMGSGVRYNFSPRYSISAGLNWMHISNLYLSQPAFSNYGINVYGPMFGLNVQLFGHRHQGSQ
jgi:hypothetical protein